MSENEITLNNGATALSSTVTAIMLNLGAAYDQEPIAFRELVSICRDKTHVPFGNTGRKLIERGLLEPDGRPHDLVRDVVLSAVTGDDFDLHLGSPVPDRPEEY